MGIAELLPWVRHIGEWIAATAVFLGPWGVFFVALADSAFVPMPQGVDALLLAQAISSPDIAYLAAGLGVLGSVFGSVVLYFVGRGAGHAMLRKRLSAEGVQRLSQLVGQWGAALLIPVTMTPLPMPMKPVVLASGIFRMPLHSFCMAIALSRAVRYFTVVYLARRYGERALDFAMEHIYVALLVCGLFVALFVVVHRLSNRWLSQAK